MTTAIDLLASDLEAGRLADSADYVRALRSSNRGERVDRDELRGLMTRLGRTTADAAGDAEAVRAFDEAAAAAIALPKLVDRERVERDERRAVEARQAAEREALRIRHTLELERLAEKQRASRPAVEGDVRALASKLPVVQAALASRLGVDRESLGDALNLEGDHDER